MMTEPSSVDRLLVRADENLPLHGFFGKSSETSTWAMKPEDLLSFVYLDEFQDDWAKLYGDDADHEALWALEVLIMSNPKRGSVVTGTGGLRKIRFGTENEGKRGGNRICYAYFPDHHLVLMIMAYGKNQKSDLTPNERAGIKQYIDQIQKWLDLGDQR